MSHCRKLYPVAFIVYVAFILLSVNLIPIAQAEEQPAGGEPKTEDTASLPDRTQRAVGGGIRGIAGRMDQFFFDEHIEAEINTTNLRVKPTIEWKKGGDIDFRVTSRLNLVLPRLERKLHLFIVNVRDDEEDLDSDESDADVINPEDEERSVVLGLRYSPLTKLRHHLQFRSGVKFGNRNVFPFVSARYRYSYAFSVWLARLTQRFYWFEDDGFGERSDMEWERKLGEDIQFRSKSSAIWSEISEGVDLIQRFTLRKFLTMNQAISLWYQVRAHTRPNWVVDAHTVAVKYRQRFLREWLYFEIEPKLQFLEDENYKGSPLLFTAIEVIF